MKRINLEGVQGGRYRFDVSKEEAVIAAHCYKRGEPMHFSEHENIEVWVYGTRKIRSVPVHRIVRSENIVQFSVRELDDDE